MAEVLNATRAELEIALQQKTTIDVSIHIAVLFYIFTSLFFVQAPTFVIPQTDSRSSPIFVANLGNLTIQSEVAQSSPSTSTQDEQFYDTFYVKLESVALLLSDYENWSKSRTVQK